MQLRDIVAAPWAITPAMFQEVQGIYARHMRGEKIDLASVEAKVGAPLNSGRQPMSVENGVAMIALDGVLAKRANLMQKISGGTSTQVVGQQFAEAIADDSIKGVVLMVDSPGGTVDGTQALADAIFNARGSKPIIAHVDGACCSAAYWIASACDSIYIDGDTTAVGSIGIIATHVDNSMAEAQAGVRVTEITAGKYKGIGSPHGPLGAGEVVMQATADHYYSVFLQAVARNRDMTVEEVAADMAEGQVFLGRQAIDAGLVDGVATLSDVLAEMSETDAETPAEVKADVLEAYSAGVALAFNDSPTSKEVLPMLTIEKIKAEAPDVAQAIANEAAPAASAAERERIRSVLALSRPGFESLVNELAFDGKTTGPEAALRVLSAMDAKRDAKLDAIRSDAREVAAVPAAATEVTASDAAPTAYNPSLIARQAAAYVTTQAALGIKVSDAEAVNHVLGDAA